MVVVGIIDSLNLGGAQNQLITVLDELSRTSKSTHLIVLNKQYSRSHWNYKVVIHEVDLREGLISGFLELYRVISKLDADLVISFLNKPNIINAVLSIFLSYKTVVSERSKVDFTQFSTHLRFLLYRISNVNLVVNNNREKGRIERSIYRSIKVRCIYNLLPDKFFEEKLDAVQNKEIVVLANYRPEKQHLELIKSLGSFKNDYVIKVYGNTFLDVNIKDKKNYFISCRDTVLSMSLTDRITLNSATTEIVDVMKSAEAVLLTSKYEGFPNVVCEAMALGKIIITTKVSDLECWIRHRENGYLLNENSGPELQQAFDWLEGLSLKSRLQIAQKNRAIAAKLFGKSNVLNYAK